MLVHIHRTSIKTIALLDFLDMPLEDPQNLVADPEFCNELRPDCSTSSYARQHCQILCKSDEGNYLHIRRFNTKENSFLFHIFRFSHFISNMQVLLILSLQYKCET